MLYVKTNFSPNLRPHPVVNYSKLHAGSQLFSREGSFLFRLMASGSHVLGSTMYVHLMKFAWSRLHFFSFLLGEISTWGSCAPLPPLAAGMNCCSEIFVVTNSVTSDLPPGKSLGHSY